MFTAARLKLTAWYCLMVASLTITLSVFFYVQTDRVLSFEYARIERRMQRQAMGMPVGQGMAQELPKIEPPIVQELHQILPEDLWAARKSIIQRLLLINIVTISIFTFVGYWWAGKTLAPIEKAHQQQRQFMADAAHELKTPITTLKASLEVDLLRPKLNAESKEILQANLKDIQGLEQLVHTLLEVSRLEHRQMRLQSVSLLTIGEEVQKLLMPLARKNQQTIVIEAETRRLAMADEAALKEICLIIVENALRYSGKKSKTTITFTQRTGEVGMVITDQGIGMSQDQLAHIFERFYRANGARTSGAQKGYGLGLSIAQSLIEQQHGSIEVRSIVDKGSRFTIWLPAASA